MITIFMERKPVNDIIIRVNTGIWQGSHVDGPDADTGRYRVNYYCSFRIRYERMMSLWHINQINTCIWLEKLIFMQTLKWIMKYSGTITTFTYDNKKNSRFSKPAA